MAAVDAADASAGMPQQDAEDYKLKFCTVCASNQNR
jgi:hypothetical protein